MTESGELKISENSEGQPKSRINRIRLQAELDRDLNKILGVVDSLDISDFNAIAYFNQIFESPEAMEDIQVVASNLESQVRRLERDVNEEIRLQNNAASQSKEQIYSVKADIQVYCDEYSALSPRYGRSKRKHQSLSQL